MRFKLRDYQVKAVNDCMSYINGKGMKPTVAVLPTGAGKSLIVSEVAKKVDGKVLLLHQSIELLKQNIEKAHDLGCENISVYSASAGVKDLSGDLIYATLGSIKTQGKQLKALGVKTVIIDECHTGISEKSTSMFMEFVKELKPKKVIGFTASPYRLIANMQGSRLMMLNRIWRGYFKTISHCTQIQELTSKGFWCPIKYEQHFFDESGLKLNSTGAEFDDRSVKLAVESQGVNNNIYLRILDLQKQGGVRGILVFTDSVATAKKFSEVIPNSAYLCSGTKKKDRAEIVGRFKSGEIQIIFNYNILSIGFDYPQLDYVISGCPTNSLARFYQQIGRLCRIHPDKKEALVIDYCGNVKRFGKMEDQEIIDFEEHGWAVFCQDRLITGTYLNGGYSVTKDDLCKKSSTETESDKILWFGKYKGKTIEQVLKINAGYLTFMLTSFDFKESKMISLKKSIVALMKKDAMTGNIEQKGSDFKGFKKINSANVTKVNKVPQIPF